MDDVWDGITAPQWSDFQSPQCSEIYFEKHQDEDNIHVDQKTNTDIVDKIPLAPLSINDIDFNDEIDKVKMTPIRIVSPKTKNKENMVKETTYEDFLTKAIQDMQIISGHHAVKNVLSHTPSNSDLSNYYTPSDKYFTPAGMIRSSIKKTGKKNSTVKNLQSTFQDIKNKDIELIKEQSIENSKSNDVEIIDELKTKSPVKKSEEKEIEATEKFVPLQLMTNLFTSKDTIVQNSKSKLPKVLPYQTRRLSGKLLVKPEVKTRKRFVSVAEAITKFQMGTPERFRTKVTKEVKPNVVGKFKAKQATLPVSPVLRSKNRVRRTNVLSEAQKDNIEMEKIMANPIKANPVKVTNRTSILHKVVKKPATVPKPFNLTHSRKDNQDKEVEKKEYKKPPLKDNKSTDLGSLKKATSLSLNDVAKFQVELKKHASNESVIKSLAGDKIVKSKSHTVGHGNSHNLKNTVAVVLASDGEAITVQEKEVIHFGIKLDQLKTTRTKAIPFSFDKRAKEFQEKKQQKIKQLQEEEEAKKKKTVEFHAKPLPTFKRSSSTPQLNSKDHFLSKPRTTPQPFSFEQRDKLLLKKREELLKQAQDVDKKAHLFHAKPAPKFKSVFINNPVNLKVEVRKRQSVPVKNVPLKAIHPSVKKLEEKKGLPESRLSFPTDKTKIRRTSSLKKLKVELHSDKRAKERREFDEKLKEKQRVEEDFKQKKAEEKVVKENRLTTMIRKQMEVKARPMPTFKRVEPIKTS